MLRTTIMIPEELKRRAEKRARRAGSSFGGLVRSSLEAALREPPAAPGEDSLFADAAVSRGRGPRDLSLRHDDFLYGDKA